MAGDGPEIDLLKRKMVVLERELYEWKHAILDAVIVNWTFTKEHEMNPRKAVHDALAWESQVALDPAVSEPAAQLVRRAEKAEERCERLRLETDGVLESAAGLVDRVHEAETLVTVLTAALVEACSTHCAGCASQ
jgi:hypothetical protein